MFCGVIVDYSGSMPQGVVPASLQKISEHGCLDILCSHACGAMIPGNSLIEGSPGRVVSSLLEALNRRSPKGSSMIIERTSDVLKRLAQHLRKQAEEVGVRENCLLLILTDTLQEIPVNVQPLSLDCKNLYLVLVLFKGNPTSIHSTEGFVKGLWMLLRRQVENPAMLLVGIKRTIEEAFREPGSIHEYSMGKLKIIALSYKLLADTIDPCTLFPES